MGCSSISIGAQCGHKNRATRAGNHSSSTQQQSKYLKPQFEMSTAKFNGLSSTPNIVKVDGQEFFLCQLTGRLSRFRAGIPGRNNSLSGTFCCWNAVATYVNRVLDGAALQNQKKSVMSSITDRAFQNTDALKIIPLPDPAQLDVFGGSMDWSEYVGDIPLITTGCQTIKNALDKIEKKKALRKEREQKVHKLGYAYKVTPDDDATLKLQRDAPVASLLEDEKKKGVEMENVLHFEGDVAEEYEDFSEYLIYYNKNSTAAVNPLASSVASIFLGDGDLQIKGDALIVTHKKPVCHAFLKAINLEDDEDDDEPEGVVKVSNKRKASKSSQSSKKSKSASDMDD